MSDTQIMPTPQEPQLAELEAKIESVRNAQKKFATYSQEKVDAIFKAAALAEIDFLEICAALKRARADSQHSREDNCEKDRRKNLEFLHFLPPQTLNLP